VPTPIVEIADLTKVYRGMERPAVDGLSLDILPGSFFGVLGPNGAGKSTLISILCGLLPATRGTVRVAGVAVHDDPQAVKRHLGLVPQDLALYPTLTARENLHFFGAMQGLQGARLRERIEACLAIARLEGLADRRAETFSGGLKRRLNLVIGLIHEPSILILDEPTVGIDPQSRHFIHESLRQLHAAGMTLLYTTHYMEEAEQLCDDIAILDHGRLLARGTVGSLLRQFHHEVIEAYLEKAISPSLDAALHQLPGVHTADCSSHKVQLLTHEPLITLPALIELLKREQTTLASLHLGAMNLEQVFLSLTGTRLRD